MSQLSDQDLAAIAELHERWIRLELAGNSLQLIAFCTDDIRWVPPDSPPLAGRLAITRYLEHNRVDLKDVQVSDVVVGGAGSIAYLTSNFTSRYTTQHSTDNLESAGTHVWILRKEREQWHVAVVTWSLWVP
jgi:ketosteroid isomerase-like protein